MSIKELFVNLAYRFLKKITSNQNKMLSSPGKITPPESVFDIPLKTIDGKITNLLPYKGKKILLVNTASVCGYTYQYKPLQELHEKLFDKLAILGFPCNDFGAQEPGTEEEVLQFCESKYSVTFPLFSKIHVIGKDKHPLYQWLTDDDKNGWNTQEPLWNFCKYVIDEEGRLINYFGHKVEPAEAVMNIL